jgi:hypothetical protein
MFKKLKEKLSQRKNFVILNPDDNTVTLSNQLFHLLKKEDKSPMIFMFRISDTFAFMQNPSLDKETQMCIIDCNVFTKQFYFETLCPSVNLMFYEMRLPADRKQKFYIEICKTPQDNKTYYKLKRKKK